MQRRLSTMTRTAAATSIMLLKLKIVIFFALISSKTIDGDLALIMTLFIDNGMAAKGRRLSWMMIQSASIDFSRQGRLL